MARESLVLHAREMPRSIRFVKNTPRSARAREGGGGDSTYDVYGTRGERGNIHTNATE